MSKLFGSIVVTAASLLFVLSGCEGPATSKNNADSHSHGDSPAAKLSLKETLEKVTSLATKIGEGFADGEGEKAHDSLHEIGHLLEGAGKLVADSSLAEETKKTLSVAVEELMDSFSKVDAKMFHNDEEGVEFSEVKEKIDAALKVVAEVTPTLK